jgi:hypothetical protein
MNAENAETPSPEPLIHDAGSNGVAMRSAIRTVGPGRDSTASHFMIDFPVTGQVSRLSARLNAIM